MACCGKHLSLLLFSQDNNLQYEHPVTAESSWFCRQHSYPGHVSPNRYEAETAELKKAAYLGCKEILDHVTTRWLRFASVMQAKYSWLTSCILPGNIL